MKIIYFIFVIFSELITAAHFYRWGNLLFVLICLLCVVLPFIKNKISYYLLKFVLLFETVTWGVTTYKLVSVRVVHHEPYWRMLLILGGVVFIIFLLFLFSFHQKIRGHFINS